ncbi:MAG: hypothetical protein K5799_15130, partial [Erythrobacter sp.]|nr:hypothetical protein [Erythrobacter sp.]
ALAEAARGSGYLDVTPSRVHRWVRERLLPATGRQVSEGRAGFRTEPSVNAQAQLLALCAWRKETKQLDPLAVLLWMDEWDVPLERVRRALRSFVPTDPPRPRNRAEREELEERLDVMAYKFAPRVKARFGRRGVEREEIADALLPILRRVAGLGGRIRNQDAVVIERMTGQDRARVDATPTEAPWLQTPAAESVEMASGLTFQTASSIVDVSDEDLHRAKPRLRFWLRTGPAIAKQVAARGDPEFAGLHSFGIQPPKAAVETLVLMLFFDSLGFGTELDGLVAEAAGGS